MRRKIIDSIAAPVGDKRKTPRKVKRRCGVCGTLLSIYNENKYCFIHTLKGNAKEIRENEVRKHKMYRAYQEKKRKERKRAKK